MKTKQVCTSLLMLILVSIMMQGCANDKADTPGSMPEDTTDITRPDIDTISGKPGDALPDTNTSITIKPAVHPDSLVAFARTLTGVPYLYASTDPARGFDCSGFITYVFTHFNTTVPRSSVDFTNYGRDIALAASKPGDLVLFTGTDSTIRTVGHMGIIESIKNDTVYFIHSTSGKANGVVISPLGNYYKGRFVKVIRVFPDEMFQ